MKLFAFICVAAVLSSSFVEVAAKIGDVQHVLEKPLDLEVDDYSLVQSFENSPSEISKVGKDTGDDLALIPSFKDGLVLNNKNNEPGAFLKSKPTQKTGRSLRARMLRQDIRDVCHKNDDGTYTKINVAEPAYLVHLEKHLDEENFVFDEECNVVPLTSTTIPPLTPSSTAA